MKRCKLSSYADDTQIFFAHNDYREVESAINSDLQLVDKWYDENGLKRHNSKYQATVMGKSDATLDFKCENSSIPVTKESGAPNGNFRNNICSEDDLRSRIFETFVAKFLACLPLLRFSNI